MIVLVRHGESEHNAKLVNPDDVGAHNVGLTNKGKEQSTKAGKKLAKTILFSNNIQGPLVYCSPYKLIIDTLPLSNKKIGLTNGKWFANGIRGRPKDTFGVSTRKK